MDILRKGKLTDFEIILPLKTYKVHKSFFCRCEFFSSLFSSSNLESISNTIKLDYEPDLFNEFINAIYDINSLQLNSENIVDLLKLSMYFQYEDLILTCVGRADLMNSHEFVDIMIMYPILLITVRLALNLCLRFVDNLFYN